MASKKEREEGGQDCKNWRKTWLGSITFVLVQGDVVQFNSEEYQLQGYTSIFWTFQLGKATLGNWEFNLFPLRGLSNKGTCLFAIGIWESISRYINCVLKFIPAESNFFVYFFLVLDMYADISSNHVLLEDFVFLFICFLVW